MLTERGCVVLDQPQHVERGGAWIFLQTSLVDQAAAAGASHTAALRPKVFQSHPTRHVFLEAVSLECWPQLGESNGWEGLQSVLVLGRMFLSFPLKPDADSVCRIQRYVDISGI